MSRKPATDTFTRFTSTTPSFSQPQPQPQSQSQSQSQSPSFTQPQPPSSPNSQPSPATPSNETPQQRVARLRAAHRAKLAGQLSTTDRLLAHGRRVADVAHRGTAYTLLGFSAVATVFAAYGLVSLVSHNRTQKRAWIEREMDKLEGARAAFLRGEADAEQLHLLEQERAGDEIRRRYEVEKKNKSWVRSFKNLFPGGDKGVDSGERTLKERAQDLQESERAFVDEEAKRRRFRMGDAEVELRPAAIERSGVAGVGLDDKGRPVPIGKMQAVPVTPSGDIRDSVVVDAVKPRGGPLDQLAGNITSGSSNSWWSSIFGGPRS